MMYIIYMLQLYFLLLYEHIVLINLVMYLQN